MSERLKPSQIEKAENPPALTGPQYSLRLFISGMSLHSIQAVKNLKHICELHLKSNYELEIIDIYQQPELASQEQIIATPLMILKRPVPERRVVGDLSDTETVLEILNVKKS